MLQLEREQEQKTDFWQNESQPVNLLAQSHLTASKGHSSVTSASDKLSTSSFNTPLIHNQLHHWTWADGWYLLPAGLLSVLWHCHHPWAECRWMWANWKEWSVQIRLLLWATLNPGLSHSFEKRVAGLRHLIVTPERETRHGHHFVASY